MPTYTFRGRDMSEAVEQVRQHLGSDAVIIDTVRGVDHIGRFVEITATGEPKPAPTQPTPPPARPRLTPRGGAPVPPPRGGARPSRGEQPPPRGRHARQAYGSAYGAGGYAPPHAPEPSPPYTPAQPPQSGYPNAPRPPQGRPAHPTHAHPTHAQHAPVSASQPMKGADRYQPPGFFTSERDVIIPQPGPGHPGGRPQARNPVDELNLLNQPERPASLRSPARGPARPQQAHPQQAHPSHQHTPQGRAGSGQAPQAPQAPQTQRALHTPPPAQGQPYAQGQPPSLDDALHAVTSGLSGSDAAQFVTERLGEIVKYIQTSQRMGGGVPAPVFEHLKQCSDQLQAAGITREYADELIEETKARLRLNQLDKQIILAQLGQVLAQNIACVDPLKGFEGKKNVLAFVGPTGVGKTTTIAKIAAHAHLTHELPVTLISTDTFRMAAVEQLSRYAEILDCPSSAARNPEELWELIDKASTPLVLVDSTGRNPRTPGQLKLLSKLFGEGWQGRTVLTVAANTREQDLKPIVEGFKPLKYDMVSITKLDETYALGTIYNVSKYTGCPIAWTTNGQRVPEDIELANPESLAVKIIMESIANKSL